MSLNPIERRRTKRELAKNIALTELSAEQIAADLNITVATLQ